MTDEVEKLKQAAIEAADKGRRHKSEAEVVQRVANAILAVMPDDADIAAAALLAAYAAVVKGAEHFDRGSGVDLLGIAIHHFMVEAMEMRTRDA